MLGILSNGLVSIAQQLKISKSCVSLLFSQYLKKLDTDDNIIGELF
jgi:hypothetical protein